MRLVMTPRNSRRRISPRTKQKYQVVKAFFQRAIAIGSSSHRNNSCDDHSIKGLKQKINSLEQQIDEITKHCQDIVSLEDYFKSYKSLTDLKNTSGINMLTNITSQKRLKGTETKLLYKTSDGKYNKYENSEYAFKSNKNKDECYKLGTKERNKKNKVHNTTKSRLHKHNHNPPSLCNNGETASNGFCSLTNIGMQSILNNNSYNGIQTKKLLTQRNKKQNIKNQDHSKETCEIKPVRIRKSKNLLTGKLDQNFIEDIIHTQYEPVKIFDPRESELSQCSVPVCRDRQISANETVLNDSELYSCMFDDVPRKRSKRHREDPNRIQSVCDMNHYNSKVHEQLQNIRKRVNAYGNSDMYDLIPVKEKSSPKTRRKMIKNSQNAYNHYNEIKENWSPKTRRKITENSNYLYRELPPSPGSLRPQLNLEAQYEFHEDCGSSDKISRRFSPATQGCFQEYMEHFETDINSDVTPANKVTEICKQRKNNEFVIENIQTQNIDEIKNIQTPQHIHEQTSINIDKPMSKIQEGVNNIEKTDKALHKIKDVLQNFLYEIKKETVKSQFEKPNTYCTSQNAANDPAQNTINLNSNVIPNSESFNNYNVDQCGMGPYATPFSNHCCYPIVPLYPVSCPITMSGGYSIPNQSFSRTNCGNLSKESKNNDCDNNPMCQTETQKLIREIYNIVASNDTVKKQDSDKIEEKRNATSDDAKITSESIAMNYKDDEFRPRLLKCYSKSCEAIGSRSRPNLYYSDANPSYSDTLLEKLSLEVTHSWSDYEMNPINPDKAKGNKFSRALRSFRLFKKKKNDIVEVCSESENEVNVHTHLRKGDSPIFEQDITNYQMHGQEHYQSSPVDSLSPKSFEYQPDTHNHLSKLYHYQSNPQEYQKHPYKHQYNYEPPYNTNTAGHYSVQSKKSLIWMHGNGPISQYSYEGKYGDMQPPLCLKEIEVKSTATQSERKVSMFQKFRNKYQKPVTGGTTADRNEHNFFTHTPQAINKPASNTKPLFNWMRLPSKEVQGLTKGDLLGYSTQKGLAEGEVNLKKVVIDKLFNKKKPFTTRKLLKALLRNDNRYAPAPNAFRPRMRV